MFRDLEKNNPEYLERLIEQSRYAKEEIISAVEMIEAFSCEREAFLNEVAYPKLTFEDGVSMGGFEGYPTEKHRELNEMLFHFVDEVTEENYASHLNNPFPVRKWEKGVKQARKQMGQIRKFIESNEEFSQTYP